MKIKYNWRTKEQCNEDALKFNPLIVENLINDSDYCIRGKLFCEKTNMYLDKIEAECFIIEQRILRRNKEIIKNEN